MDTTLKQRLIGAGVLVALAVIFLPMLIKGPAPDSGVKDVSMTVPETPATGYETRELPLVATPNAAAPAVVEAGAAPAATATAGTPETGNTDAADIATPEPAVAAGNYAVTFGAYGSAADADRVIARLKQSRLPGFSETATINGRPAWRVRVGPYADQAQAEAARLEAVKIRSDVKAQVITLDAMPAAPASAALAATTPVPVASAPVPATPVTTAETRTAPGAKPVETRAVETKPVVAKAPEPAKAAPVPASRPATAKAVPAPVAPAASGVGFAVQLGAFAAPTDANALRDKVRAAGFSAFVEQVNTDKGTLNRVRVGPVASRDAADKLKAQVAAKVGIDGMVRPHP